MPRLRRRVRERGGRRRGRAGSTRTSTTTAAGSTATTRPPRPTSVATTSPVTPACCSRCFKRATSPGVTRASGTRSIACTVRATGRPSAKASSSSRVRARCSSPHSASDGSTPATATYDDVLGELGRFLVAMTDADGKVFAFWQPSTQTASGTSIFSTGETWFALNRLERLFPDAGWREPAERVGRYVMQHRDDAEDVFPPTSDHWGAYAIDEMQHWATPPSAELGEMTDAYAERLAGIFGVQVRFESQRTDSGVNVLLRGHQALPSGLGTLGEGLGALARYEDARGRPDDAAAIADRMACAVGMLVDRQVTSDDVRSGRRVVPLGCHPDGRPAAPARPRWSRMADFTTSTALVEGLAVLAATNPPRVWSALPHSPDRVPRRRRRRARRRSRPRSCSRRSRARLLDAPRHQRVDLPPRRRAS